MQKNNPNDPFQVVVWSVIQKTNRKCQYCSVDLREEHKDHCLFGDPHGYGLRMLKPFRSECFHDWFDGFYDGMNQFCKIDEKDNPHYLLGNEAGNKMYYLPAAVT